ncbi:WxL domain-containing protein [Enterococcus faecalis]|uniref:WxL domain-containing protein n=1 Tax=Enterococcus faecalis TaxID=1351 RepID=UPI0029368827|nr:WxL domain-containing protein [Enterococcus faecalis]MDV2523379.1 WxL domain-containing protein [Enterococcus faecalis]
MKQTKWQRLATIGLCSSLVINAFSGVTAVAETITIESSPTVASSAKEATSASSATPESTESSQETTETSREEVTQETVEQEDTTEIAQEENLLEPSGIQAKIMPRAFVWAATGTTNRTTVRLNDVVDYRMKLENITTDDTNSDIVGPIRIESKLAAGMTRPTSVIIKVGPEEQNVVIGEGSHNANSGGEYFVWTESTRTVTAFINRLHGRTSGNTGYIKTLYFQTRITSGTHNEKKYIDSTIRFNGFGAVNRRNEMTYVDRFSGNLGLKGNLKFYDEDGVASKEQMSLSINPVLFKSTNSRVEGTLLRYPLTMTNAGSGLYRFDTGLKNIGTSNGGSWFFFSNDIVINFATATTNRIDKIVLAPPKATLPDSRTGVMTSRAYTSTTYTRSNYDISTYNFTKATGKTWRITNRSSNSGVSTNIMFSDNLVGTTGQFNKGNSGATINYYIYYKKLYENFVNSNGQKITPPSGFTQGKRTVINSEAYTFKQSGTLPDTYQADGKTYKFKGWYKGKTKPNTLTTTKAPSYAVTYDDNDDLNVVYEEIKVFDFPALTYQFGFVDESGKRVDASTIKLTYDNWHGEGLATNSADSNKPDYWKTVSLEKGQVAPTKNNLKEIAYPAQSLEILSDRSTQHSAANLTFTLPNYYEKISVYNKSGTFDIAYPFPNIQGNNYSEPFVEGENKLLSRNFELKNNGSQSFIFNRTTTAAPIDIQVPSYLRKVVHNPNLGSGVATYLTIDKPVYYYLTNRKVTENFVDTNGTKITPPTGFTQGNQIPMTSNTFKYTSAKVLPASYTTGGKTYIFQGWYKGKTKPNTLTTSTTPTYNTTFDGNDDMTAMYKEEVPKASVALTRTTAETVTSGGNVTWRATITNTSQAPLTTATIKKSTAWTTGLAAPTAMIVTPAGGTAKTVPVTATTWTNGVSLGTDIPVGKSATVQFTTKATGTAGQVLRAGITTSGNYSGVSASATVRVKDNDQAIVTPTAEGFISVPTFNFGQVGVAGSTQQHSLKKAADYYGNGTRNPYLRIKKTQPNWSLTAQLSQPKSATDSLPTTTRLLLGAAPVSSFSNYNQPTELKNAVGTTSTISLNANNTATRIIANQQFTGSNIYQLDFTFNNVKLEVPANQGVKGQQYQAAVTWNLVTGP